MQLSIEIVNKCFSLPFQTKNHRKFSTETYQQMEEKMF